MRIYNTLAQEKQEFIPISEGKVLLYVCGPTVYNYIHIGNARPICVFDTLRRYLEYKGYEVTHAQNFTDIDDRIIARANEEGITAAEFAGRYIRECEIDAQGLGAWPPTVVPKATETIDEIISIVEDLTAKGFAYEAGGDVYFRARKFEGYGKLSRQPLDELESGARISIGEQKEDALDFALWKSAKPGEPSWPSPWGNGRPGWHIECSAMTRKYMGEAIDIHAGGQDLIFPHHENEIAQSECSGSSPYARYWMHNGMINMDKSKMSKSLGNFFTVREVAEKYGYGPIKLLMLSAHYRSPMTYSIEVLEQSKAALERIRTCRRSLDFIRQTAGESEADHSPPEFIAALNAGRAQFEAAMDDDLNTADAIATVFDLVRDLNIHFAQTKTVSDVDAATALFDTLCDVLGILIFVKDSGDTAVDAGIQALIDERQAARKNRDFARADAIRDALLERGIVLKDTPNGVQYERIGN
ncbi:MAG: cysteine--tRNA ligase [Oscillospiraceae bacterium]|nr:cysteine--tRNA ligase [Oscillospiraceae bacterium]